jgi:hypothetical protein
MTGMPMSAEDGRTSVLFTLKRGLPRSDWDLIEGTLSKPEKESL